MQVFVEDVDFFPGTDSRTGGEEKRIEVHNLLLAIQYEGMVCQAGRVNKKRKLAEQNPIRFVQTGLRKLQHA
jgi:hypothetical protein